MSSNHDRAPSFCRCCLCAVPLLVPHLRGAGIAPHSGAAREDLLALLAAVLATAPLWRNYALMSQLDGAETGRCLFVELRQGTIASCGRSPGFHMPRTPQKQPVWIPQSRLRGPQHASHTSMDWLALCPQGAQNRHPQGARHRHPQGARHRRPQGVRHCAHKGCNHCAHKGCNHAPICGAMCWQCCVNVCWQRTWRFLLHLEFSPMMEWGEFSVPLFLMICDRPSSKCEV